MPKGLKRQANKNKTRKQTGEVTKRPLPMADEGQLYGKVERGLGDRRFEIVCSDGETRIGRLRGKIRKRKKSWLKAGMWVICACRDFQVEKVDIIELLQEDEVRRLECLGELSTSNQRAEAASDEEEQAFDFDDI